MIGTLAKSFIFSYTAQSEHDLNSYHNNMTNYTNYEPFRVTYEEMELDMLCSQGCQGSAYIQLRVSQENNDKCHSQGLIRGWGKVQEGKISF